MRMIRSSEDWLVLGKTKLRGVISSGDVEVIYRGCKHPDLISPRISGGGDANSLGSWRGIPGPQDMGEGLESLGAQQGRTL